MTMKIATRLWLPALVLGGIVLLMSGTVGLRTSGQIALSDALLRDQEAKLQDATTWQKLTNTNVVPSHGASATATSMSRSTPGSTPRSRPPARSRP